VETKTSYARPSLTDCCKTWAYHCSQLHKDCLVWYVGEDDHEHADMLYGMQWVYYARASKEVSTFQLYIYSKKDATCFFVQKNCTPRSNCT
jgi:hypothetical protein